MRFKFLKKTLIITAAVCTIGTAVSLTACSGTIKTRHPTAKITITFNDEDYELTYKLYRNMYPVTVQHFIELTKSGFYDNTIIHDYDTNDWYGGEYAYISEEDSTELDIGSYEETHKHADYFTQSSKELEYYTIVRNGFSDGTFTPYVWPGGLLEEECTYENALCTITGEFTTNDHKIKNGALGAEFGALRMYYTPKMTNSFVWAKNGFGEMLSPDYKYNCATSMFAIQVGSGSSLAQDDYCEFAVLKNSKSEDRLNDLIDDIADFISDEYDIDEEYNFYTSVSGIATDNYDEIDTDAMGQTTTYKVTEEPIIIKSVKITKY